MLSMSSKQSFTEELVSLAGISVISGRITLSITWPPEEFSNALLRNSHAFLRTRRVEDQAADLVRLGFPANDCLQFLRAVCLWGGRAGTAKLVEKKNSVTAIQAALSGAWRHLARDEVVEALDAVTSLDGLNVSFGSKHLRMLAPTKAVVLDSVIDQGLGYSRTPAGYTDFLRDCAAIQRALNGPNGSPNPIDINGPWRLCDVEMAIYSKLRGL